MRRPWKLLASVGVLLAAILTTPARAADPDDDDRPAPSAAPSLPPAAEVPQQDQDDDEARAPVTEVVVTARRLDVARASVEPSLGAATYTMTNELVESRPAGETTRLSQVLLQAPGVVDDGSGQLRARAQSGLEYRINNIILPPGLTDLGESLSARMADRIELVTGALPAQYGLQVGGIVNVTTKNGAYQNGGQAELYGGSHGEIEPAVEIAGARGATSYFASGSFLHSNAGLAAPDRSASPLHDRTDQAEGFVFVDHVIDPASRLSVILGGSDEAFQIPHARGLDAATLAPGAAFRRPLNVGGVASFRSERLGGGQRQATLYGALSYLHTTDRATLQVSAYAEGATLRLDPDPLGDVLFTGAALAARDRTAAAGLQVEGVYPLGLRHTLRAGVIASWRREQHDAEALALPVDAAGREQSDTPVRVSAGRKEDRGEGSLFLQDEWRPGENLTINAGLRLDRAGGEGGGEAASPRASIVWTSANGTTLHAGYARYFVPAPEDEIALGPAALAGTSGAARSVGAGALRAETDDYIDIGVGHKSGRLTLGLDGYWRRATNLIDSVPVGGSTLTRPFNYAAGLDRGVEFSAIYASGPFSVWGNLAIARAEGRRLVSNQFLFTPAELAYAAAHWVRLSSDPTVIASAGASYAWRGLKLSGDLDYGAGTPRTLLGGPPNGASLPAHLAVNLSAVYRLRGLDAKPLDLRLDVLNAFDSAYLLRDGTALGDSVPRWAPRRGIFVGFEQSF